MPFDPNDPDTKAAIAAAVSEAVSGLDTKNKELLAKLKDAKKGSTIEQADVDKLEAKIETLEAENKAAVKAAKDAAKLAETSTQALSKETAFSQKLISETALTEALVAANVAKQFLPAAKALLASQVAIKVDGENRLAVVGDKPVTDFVKSWAASEDGKHYVAAPSNGGAGASGGASGAGGKVMTNDAFQQLTPVARSEFMTSGGKLEG